MKRSIGIAMLVVGLLAPLARPARAIITFTQLDENTFTVSHRVKGFGSRGKATRMVYTKSASLCIAAGYTHYQVVDQESQASQYYEAANASLTLKFFREDAQGRVSCESGSDRQYVQDAREKLDEQGYSPPEPEAPSAPRTAAAADEPAEGAAPCPQGCTINQIAAMARAGLSDEKIRAACRAGDDESEGDPVN